MSPARPEPQPSDWPGRRLGLPESGPRSIARPGRRILGLIIDYVPAIVISVAFFQYEALATLAVFAALQIVAVTLMGGSIGHLVLGMRVVPLAGGRLRIWQPLVRTLLLCLVIPAVIWNRDQRGGHDIIAGTLLVRI
ncbi:RDD family protein [Homoserinibacter sp. YIM 151385]|uniref:RDD family protein n=1 Tax=Homoserinibacter sp. YIM 151385 TaxID=2985506 RepID=UPI0022F123D8|nr:RDD family protein [Homoserinibacter sp. YIM 151385]WBU38480.1 RDD family protein [Homoserinibacter sp. YIM 151385]